MIDKDKWPDNWDDFLIPEGIAYNNTHKHAIIEAVCGLVMVQSFADLAQVNRLKEGLTFQQELTVKNRSIELKSNSNDQTITVNKEVLSGYQWVDFNEGKRMWLIRAENIKTKSVFSTHSFQYPGWQEFKIKLWNNFNAFEKLYSESIIESVVLNYVDSFLYVPNTVLTLDHIFNSSGEVLPRQILDNDKDWSSQLSIESSIDHILADTVQEQCNIHCFSPEATMNRTLRIVHNASYKLKSPLSFQNLVSDRAVIETLLEVGHENNRDFLRKLLSPVCQQKIGLPKKNITP